jgi:hypothetical protein
MHITMNSAKNIKINNKRLKAFSSSVRMVTTRSNFGGMKQEERGYTKQNRSKYIVTKWTGYTRHCYDSVADCCKYGNKNPGNMKGGKFE